MTTIHSFALDFCGWNSSNSLWPRQGAYVGLQEKNWGTELQGWSFNP